MKKSYAGLIIIFILFTTYSPKFVFQSGINFNIKKIVILDNTILDEGEIKKDLIFLYKKNLFFLNEEDVKKALIDKPFLESFSLKKIYPFTIKINIVEKKPIAILHIKKQKFYISDKGDLINFKEIEKFEKLPNVFGNGKNFYLLYKDLQNIDFPIKTVKNFYFFESGRWDLVLRDKKIIKLPNKDYLLSLKNFMLSKENKSFSNYKIFDYRIKNQLILN
tara:strand:+ start:237 stop:896 length:660 start_codon:yes stop_codon:yes gene_type:complete